MVSVLVIQPTGEITTVTIATFLGPKDQLLLHNHGSSMFWPSNAQTVLDILLCRSSECAQF